MSRPPLADRPPDLDDGVALLHALFGFCVAKNIAQASGRRVLRIVVVDSPHRRAGIGRRASRFVTGTDRVVEDQNLRRAGMLLDQRLAFRVVNSGAFRLVGKVLDRGQMVGKSKAVRVELEGIAQRPAVIDRHLPFFIFGWPRFMRLFRPINIFTL